MYSDPFDFLRFTLIPLILIGMDSLILLFRKTSVDNTSSDRDDCHMPKPPNNRSIHSFLQKYWMTLFIVASVAYVGYYINSQLSSIDDNLSFSPLPLVGSAFFQLLFWTVSSQLWGLALRTVTSTKVTLIDSFFQLCLVNLGKYLPGKIWGMLARGSYLNQRHAIDVSKIIQATYIEQVYLVGSGVVVASLVLAVITANRWMWLVALLILAMMTAAIVYQKYLEKLLRLADRLRGAAEDYRSNEFSLSGRKQLYMLVMYMLVWVLLSMVLYGLYMALFQAELSLTMAAVMTLACVAGMLAGFIAIFAPGGVGVREAVSGSILAAYMPIGDAVLVVLLFRIWLATLDVLVGGSLYLGKRKKLDQAINSIGEESR